MSQKIDTFHHMVIMDKSGSMTSLRQMVVDTFNETVQNVRKLSADNANIKHYVYFVTFDSEVNVVREKELSADVKEMLLEEFQPDGLTALYDGIGHGIEVLKKNIQDDSKETALITVLTDGHENFSHDYDAGKVKELVQSTENNNGWTFTYVGASVDYKETARSLGFSDAAMFDNSAEGMRSFSKRNCIKSAAYVTLTNAQGMGAQVANKLDFSSATLDANFDEKEYERQLKAKVEELANNEKSE